MEGSTAGRRLSRPALLAFAAPQLAIYALQIALSVHLPRYFATHMGLSLAAVGTAFALVRAIDIPLDPLLGLAMDRTRTRLGRYRVWTLAGAPVLMAALYLLIRPPAPLGQAGLVAVLLVLFLGYSWLYLAQLSWAATLATNYHERSRIFAALTATGVVGAVAVLLVPVTMSRLGYTDAQGVEAMIGFVIVVAPVATLIMARTPERITPDHAQRFGLSDYLALLKRGNVVRLLGADLLIQMGPHWMGALYIYDFTLVRGFSTTAANLLLLIYLASGLIGAPAASALARRAGKHRALIASTSLFALCLVATRLLRQADFALAAGLMSVAGAAFAGFNVAIRALTADIADEARLDHGHESTGLMFALTNATTKLATAIALFLTFHVLDRIGFDAREGAVNSARALQALEVAFLAGPMVFVMAGGLCFVGYRLDHRRHAEIRRALDARDAEASERR